MLHFGWFLSYGVQSWNRIWSGQGASEWSQPELYVDAARSLERAGFDYMMFEDGSFVPDAFGGSQDFALRTAAAAPKHDPLPLLAVIASQTNDIGLIGTVTTSFYPPFLAARLMTTLDHLTKGRVGMNLVTAHNIRSAENFGLQDDWAHDQRYARAEEWMQVVSQLWQSWDADALRADLKNQIFVDPAKVRPINFDGTYYRSRGPLNTAPGPQRRPVICQAGASPAGLAFGARHADTIIAQGRGIDSMRDFRQRLSHKMIEFGRDPREIKLLFICDVHVFATQAEAIAFDKARYDDHDANIAANLYALTYSTGIDFTAFDLDEPMPQVSTNNAQSVLQHMIAGSEGKTLRQHLQHPISQSVSFVGTPESIADDMQTVADATGADGFLVGGALERRYIAEISDGLGAELRRRGMARDSYQYDTFRENLLAF